MEQEGGVKKASRRQAAGRGYVEEFDVLVDGVFSRTAVSVEYRPGRVPLHPSAEALVDRVWHRYVRASTEKGITVYDGNLFRLDSFHRTNGHLQLTLSDAEFRGCIGTASEEFTSAFPDLPRANPLTVSAVLVTSDEKIVVEKRSLVDWRRRPYHVIAGYMEREWDGADGTEPHPFDTLEREVREELGLALDASRLSATGLVRSMCGSELCFRCPVDLSFNELLELQSGAATDCEIETLEAVDDSAPALASFLTIHGTDLAPTGRACLLLYGRYAYGEEWYEGAQRG